MRVRCRRAAQVVDLRAGDFRGVLEVLLLERAHQLGVRQKTVGVGQQNQRDGRKEQCGGRKSQFFHDESVLRNYGRRFLPLRVRGRRAFRQGRSGIMPGTHLCGHLAGCILAGAAPETRDGFRDKGTKYSGQCARSDKTVSVRPGKTACIHPAKQRRSCRAKQRASVPANQQRSATYTRPGKTAYTRPGKTAAGPEGKMRVRDLRAVFRRIGRTYRPAGICGGTGPPGPTLPDAARSRSAFVAAKQGPNRRPKDSVLQKKRSGAIWSDKSQVFFKIF